MVSKAKSVFVRLVFLCIALGYHQSIGPRVDLSRVRHLFPSLCFVAMYFIGFGKANVRSFE